MEGMKVADIYAKFGIDIKDLRRKLKLIDQELGQSKKNIFELDGIFKKMGKTLVSYFAVEKVADLTKQSIMLASSMRELNNVYQVFLDKSADKYMKKSDELAEKLGRSDYMMRKMTSSGLALSKSMGQSGESLGDTALQISELAVDLASFNDTADDEAFVALAAALRGEQEPLRRYKILLSDATLNQYALSKGSRITTREMSEQEKAMWRWKFILENSKEAQGDAVRTQKEFANQLRVMKGNLQNLGVDIGNELIDPLGEALQVLNEFLKASSKEIKIEADTEAFEIFKKVLADFFVDIIKVPIVFVGDLIRVFNMLSTVIGAGTEGLVNFFGRPFIDAAKQKNKIGIPKSFPEKKVYTTRTDEWVARGNQLLAEQEANADKTLEALLRELNNIDEFAGITGQEAIDVLEEKLKLVDKALFESIEEGDTGEKTKDMLSSMREAINLDIENIKLQEENQNENISLAEERARQLEKESEEAKNRAELERIKAENIAKARENWDIELKTMQAEEELEKAKREMNYNELNEAKDLIKQFEGMTRGQARERFELLSGMVKDLEPELFFEIQVAYQDYINSIEASGSVFTKVSENISDVAKVTAELSNIFGGDLLPVMTNTLNSISGSMSMMALGGVSALAGGLGLVTAGIGVVDYLNSSDLAEKEAEANAIFEQAVDKFYKAVDDFSIGQKLEFGQLEKPKSFADVFAGTGSASSLELETDFLGFLTGIGFSVEKGLTSLLGFGKASDASIDTSALKEQLATAGYSDIDVDAIMGKYAIRDEYRTWLGKKKSYISGYDVEGAMAEIKSIIDEAYKENLGNLKSSLGIAAQDYSNALLGAYESGEYRQAVEEQTKQGILKAIFYSSAFEQIGDALGTAVSEELFDRINIDLTDIANMSIEELISTMEKLAQEGGDFAGGLFDELGFSIEQTTESLDKMNESLTDVPSSVKVATARYQAINSNYNNTVVYQVENNYSKDFDDMVLRATNKDRMRSTNVMRGGL